MNFNDDDCLNPRAFFEKERTAHSCLTEMYNTKFSVMDEKTYIKVINVMGGDFTVANAARVSRGTQKCCCDFDETYDLINNLFQWGHTSPLEFCSITFEVCCPIYIARQWFRHRTFRYMERSGRYTQTPEEAYIPNVVRNSEGFKDYTDAVHKFYTELTDSNVANQDSRSVLPEGTLTTFWFNTDLHNLFHFLKLRLDKGAQPEMRFYARRIHKIVEQLFPVCTAAFDNFVLNAVTFSSQEMNVLKSLLKESNNFTEEHVRELIKPMMADESNTQRDTERIVNKIMKLTKES